MTEELADWRPAGRPGHRTLAGARVRLEPLDPAAHADELFAAAEAAEADVWRYLPYGPFASAGELGAWLAERAGSRDPLFLAVTDLASGRARGVVSYLRVEPEHGCIEIGHIWFGAGLARTPAATEAIFLLLRHAFADLGHRRVEWKCNAANARSHRAAERFGFTFEGVFRQHMIVKGGSRDTAWFSLLDGEWPAVRAGFAAWLEPGNFGADGAQRRPLAALR
jgi:RimJ/RimL family protein N-acetyltransferase